MYANILLPTDGSPAADAAVTHALDLAERYGARIHALYVVDASTYSALDAGSDIVMSALEQEGDSALATVAEAAREAGIEVETQLVEGGVYRAILDYAASHDVDLIVMGTHGRRGLDRYLLGSVTERVVRTADVPVLTVRMPSGDGD